MLLRRVTEHVREQNWTAIGIDFVIVVVGVFVGIQVSNWNETRAERCRDYSKRSTPDRDSQNPGRLACIQPAASVGAADSAALRTAIPDRARGVSDCKHYARLGEITP